MQLGDRPLGEGDDRHAAKLQLLVEGGDVGLVARNAVERLGQHQLKQPGLRVTHQLLDAGAQHHAGAGDAGILIAAGNRPAFARGVFAAQPQLVLDRGLPLLVGGVAGIKCDARRHAVVSIAV
jgi:hypothetical protein